MASQQRHAVLDERVALCDLMVELGPDAPTWSGVWTTRDLAAHLVVRETRLDAGPGLVLGGIFARHTDRVRTSALEKYSYEELVAELRGGPPRLWPFRRWPDLDVHEWFVHHEDVRRANGCERRDDLGQLDAAVWKALDDRWAKMLTRPLEVGVVHDTPDGRTTVARTGDETVTVTAAPGDLMLRLFGRPVVVRLDGDPGAVEKFESTALGI